MRKLLIIRSQYVLQNLTDTIYKIRFVNDADKKIVKSIVLQPKEVYPIDISDLDLKCQLCNDMNKVEWSSLIRVRTIAVTIPKNATVSICENKNFI